MPNNRNCLNCKQPFTAPSPKFPTIKLFGDETPRYYLCSEKCYMQYDLISRHTIDADEITCPYCKTEYEDSPAYVVDYDDDFVCDECGKTFGVVASYSVTYISKPRMKELLKVVKVGERVD